MSSPADERAIVLVGPMGAGKTSIGRKVARALRCSFTDTDIAVSSQYGPIPEIFATRGEAEFRELEADAVQKALGGGGVVALGGGAVLSARTRRALASHRVVLLWVDPRVVRGRVKDGSRPLLEGPDAIDAWTRIADARRPLYEEVADIEFDTSRGPIQNVVDRIVAWARSDTSTPHSSKESR